LCSCVMWCCLCGVINDDDNNVCADLYVIVCLMVEDCLSSTCRSRWTRGSRSRSGTMTWCLPTTSSAPRLLTSRTDCSPNTELGAECSRNTRCQYFALFDTEYFSCCRVALSLISDNYFTALCCNVGLENSWFT